jgi:hypothetical protein
MLGILLTLLALMLFINKRYEYSLLAFLLLITNGFQILPSAVLLTGAPIEKPTDMAIFFVLGVFLHRFDTIRQIIRRERIFRWLVAFLAFIALDAIYSYQVLGYDLIGILKVFRNYLCLLSFGVFVMVPTPVLLRVLHVLAVITVIQCILYLAQIPTGLALLQAGSAGSEITVHGSEETGFIRFYNTPMFLTPTLFYYLFVFHCKSQVIHKLVLSLLILTVVAPMHRNYMFCLALVASLHVLFHQSQKRRILYIAGLLLIGIGLLTVDPVNNRLTQGLDDFKQTFTGKQSFANNDYDNNTFAYRMAHLFERIDYVVSQPDRYVFGIGLLSEDTRQAEKLPFSVGVFNERLERTTQINTGDIAWSLLILQLGFLGTGLFVLLMVHLIRFFYQHRSIPFSALGLSTLSLTLLISFTGTEILMIPFRTYLLLLAAIVVKMAYSPSAVSVSPGQPQPIYNQPLVQL